MLCLRFNVARPCQLLIQADTGIRMCQSRSSSTPLGRGEGEGGEGGGGGMQMSVAKCHIGKVLYLDTVFPSELKKTK